MKFEHKNGIDWARETAAILGMSFFFKKKNCVMTQFLKTIYTTKFYYHESLSSIYEFFLIFKIRNSYFCMSFHVSNSTKQGENKGRMSKIIQITTYIKNLK